MLDVDFGGAAHGTVRWVMKEGVSLEVLHVRRKDMKEYRKAGVHHAEFYRDQGVVKWGVYKWMMRRARGQEARARWDKQMRNMWKGWVAQWGMTRKKPRSGRGAGAVQEKVLHRGEDTMPGRAYCCVHRWDSRGRGGRYKVRAGSGTMSMRICSGETTFRGGGGGRTGGPVLEMHQEGREGTVAGPQNDDTGVPDPDHSHYGRQGTAVGAGATAAQGGAGGQGGPGGYGGLVGGGTGGERTGVQIGWDTPRGLQEEDDGVAVSFRVTDTERLKEEAPLLPAGYKCAESGRRIRLTIHGLPADRVWYLVLVQAYPEQGRAKGERAWCHGVVVIEGWKARTDNEWAVYRGVKELSVNEGVREYDIGRHKVYCHCPREVVRIPEPTEGRKVVFLDRSGVEGQPPKAGAADIRVKGVGQETESIVDKMVYRLRHMEKCKRSQMWMGR